MGKMKEIYMQVMHANDGIPEEMTIEDIIHMQELKIYEWQEYEREKRKNILLNLEDAEEIKKVELTEAKFKGYLREDFDEREQEQKRLAKLYKN